MLPHRGLFLVPPNRECLIRQAGLPMLASVPSIGNYPETCMLLLLC